MNSDFSQLPPDERAQRLTAFILGELPDDQAEQIRQALAADPELAREHEQLRQTIELIRETTALDRGLSTEGVPLRLDDGRRQKLLETFKTPAPRAVKRRRLRELWYVPMSIAAALVGLLVLVSGLPMLSRSKSMSRMQSIVSLHDGLSLETDAELAASDHTYSKQAELPKSEVPTFGRDRSVAMGAMDAMTVTLGASLAFSTAPEAKPAAPVKTPPNLLAIALPSKAGGDSDGDGGVTVRGTALGAANPSVPNFTEFNRARPSLDTWDGKMVEQVQIDGIIMEVEVAGANAAAPIVAPTPLPRFRVRQMDSLRADSPVAKDEIVINETMRSVDARELGETAGVVAGEPLKGTGLAAPQQPSVSAQGGTAPRSVDVRYAVTGLVLPTPFNQPEGGEKPSSQTTLALAPSASPVGITFSSGLASPAPTGERFYRLRGQDGFKENVTAIKGEKPLDNGAVSYVNGVETPRTPTPQLIMTGRLFVEDGLKANVTDGTVGKPLEGTVYSVNAVGFVNVPQQQSKLFINPLNSDGDGVELYNASPRPVELSKKKMEDQTGQGRFGDANSGGGGGVGFGADRRSGGRNGENAQGQPPVGNARSADGILVGDYNYLSTRDSDRNQITLAGDQNGRAAIQLPAIANGTLFGRESSPTRVEGKDQIADVTQSIDDAIRRQSSVVAHGAVVAGTTSALTPALPEKSGGGQLGTNSVVRNSGNLLDGSAHEWSSKQFVEQVLKSDDNGSVHLLPPHGQTEAVMETSGTFAFGPSAAPTEKIAKLNQELNSLQTVRERLNMQIIAQEVDSRIPRSSAVEIVNPAEPEPAKSPTLWGKITGVFGGKSESTARIQVERDSQDVAGLGEQKYGGGFDPYWLQTEPEKIQSKPVLNKVIENLKLKEKWAGKNSDGNNLSTEEAYAMLKKMVDVRPDPNTSLIDIRVKGDDSAESASIANEIAQTYAESRRSNRLKVTQGGIDVLKKQLAQQDEQVSAKQKEVNEIKDRLIISATDAAGNGAATTLEPENLRRLTANLIEGKAQYESMNTLNTKLKSTSREELKKALPVAYPDARLSEHLQNETAAKQKLADLSANYSSEHPEIKRVTKVLEEVSKQINEDVDGIMVGIDTRVASKKAEVDSIQKAVDDAKEIDIKKSTERRPYFIAKRDLEAQQVARERLKMQIATAQEAVKPAEPASPKPAVLAPIPQPEIQTRDNAFSTFSLNVADVSFKLAAASLERGAMPDAAGIRSEEFLNAFDYRDPLPAAGVPVSFAWERARYPFAQNRDALRFSIKTAAQGRDGGKPLNLVLLLDNSGSMERADRVRIIQESLHTLAAQLKPQDKISVVTFARTATLRVDGATGAQADEVAKKIGALTPEGGTNLEDALDLAYRTALRHYAATAINRVVLLTDGAANLGNVEPKALKAKVESFRKQGVALDCFGIGWEGFNDDLLEQLSRNGDGRYGFVNAPEEAATEFAAQLAGALRVAASDVKVQVEFNPKRVTAYRQIGYAKHQLTKQQFRDNTVDAAEIGASEAGNGLYIIETNPRGEGPIATVRARFRIPQTSDYREHEWVVPFGSAVELEQAGPAMRLATVASAFSESLASSPYATEVTSDRLLKFLSGVPEVFGADQRPKKLEWMVRQAKAISGK